MQLKPLRTILPSNAAAASSPGFIHCIKCEYSVEPAYLLRADQLLPRSHFFSSLVSFFSSLFTIHIFRPSRGHDIECNIDRLGRTHETGYAHRHAMQEASVHVRRWALLELSGKRLSFRIGLIRVKLLLLTSLPYFTEDTKSGARARELFALLLLALPSVLTVQKLLLLL